MSGASSHVVLSQAVDAEGRGLWLAILRMGWPTVLAGLLRSSYAIIDTWSAGHLDTVALAGLTAAVFFAWMFHSLSGLVSLGALSAIAQARGRDDVGAMRSTARRSLRLALGVGTGLSALLFFGAPVALARMDVPAPALASAIAYIRILALFGPAYWVFDTLEQSFRGAGDPRTPLKVSAVLAVLNLGLNPALALGLGLGVGGLAGATAISWCAGALWLYRRAVRAHLLDASEAEGASIFTVLKVGLPVALTGVAFDLVWTVLTPLVAASGPVALAVVGVGHRLESLSYMSAHGVGAACASLVGQAMGMNRPDLVRLITWRSVVLGLVAVGAWAGVELAVPDVLFGIFTQDPAVIALGGDYIALSALPMVLQAVELIVLGAFEGVGKTVLPTAISFSCYAARIPMAFALASGGIYGIFITTSSTAFAAGVLVSLAFVLFGPKPSPSMHGGVGALRATG